MRKILLSLLSLVFGFSLMAQTESISAGDIAIAKSSMTIERKAIFSQNMKLTDDESKLFWPIFEEYEAKKALTFEQSLKNLMEISDNFDAMTDDKATDIIKDVLSNQQKDLKLLDQYQKKIAKVLGAKKAFRFVQIEFQINAIKQVQVLEIPLVD
jgi:hypothetical protein